MPKITLVEPQKKSASRQKKRFNIFLDGQFAFGADENLIVEHRLVVGKSINSEDLEKLLSEAEIGKLVEKVYRLLNIRLRSEKEIRDYFRVKNYESRVKGKEEISELVISELVKKLKSKGLIDDVRFTKEWVEARSKKKGINAIKSELFQKGISREIIEQVLSIKYQVSREEETAKSLLEKKFRIWKNLPEMEFKQKALRFLMGRGFNYDVAKEVVEDFIKIIN